MSAKNGSAVTLHRRGLFGLCVAAVFVLCAVFSAGASASRPTVQTYLATGDSLSFGYSKQLFDENLTNGDQASHFENGYVNHYYAAMKPTLEGIQKQDLGCPGETSDSFIGNGPLAETLEAYGKYKINTEKGELPCEYHGAGFPLHNEYGAFGAGAKSQLEAALEYLGVDAALGKPVTTVTLNIGANDQLHFIANCEVEAKPAEEKAFIKAVYEEGKTVAEGEAAAKKAGEESVKECLFAGAVPLGTHIGENIGLILYVLRHGATFGSVNFTGKIVFLASYNPYGNLLAYPSRKEQSEGVNDEVLFDSNYLSKTFNEGFAEAVAAGSEGNSCTANARLKFNPENHSEPNNLQAWTNMTNATESNGQKNGPDIHPTPRGYQVIGSLMVAQCGA